MRQPTRLRKAALKIHAVVEAKEEAAFQAANTPEHQAMVNAMIAKIGQETK